MFILLANIPALFIHKVKVFDSNYTYCGMIQAAIKPYFVTFFVFGYTLPLGAICIIYIFILNHLRVISESSVEQTRQRTARASRLIALVVVVFALCWLPMHVNQLFSAFQKVPSGKLYEVFRVLANCLAYSSSCANPIIYNFISTQFKEGFSEVVCCWIKKSSRQNGSQRNGLTSERTPMVMSFV